jgi:hypothetical protein
VRWRQRLAETRSQLVQPTTAALPQGIVVVGTECRQNGIDPVDEGDPLADQLCPLANAPPRILVAFIRDRHHRADARFAAKPCQQCAQQQLGIDAIGLRPTQASVRWDARGLDDMDLDTVPLEPSS